MDFDSFSFIRGFFEDINSEEGFLAEFIRGDSGYKSLLPHVKNGKVIGMTSIRMDYISIPAAVYPNIKKRTFKMMADAIFEKRTGKDEVTCYAGQVIIDRICFEHIEPQNIEKIGDKIIIRMFDIVLQYQTAIVGVCDLTTE